MEVTHAEILLGLARAVRLPPGVLIEAAGPVSESDYARIKLALDFERRGPGLIFRAIVEEWGPYRIVREVY